VLVVVRVDTPVNVVKQWGCKSPTSGTITYAPVGNKNTNAGDDHASAQAVSGRYLRSAATVQPEGHQVANPQLCRRCPGLGVRYDITLREHRPGVYNDGIELKETPCRPSPSTPVGISAGTAKW
jgi:hypothetical protein